MTENYSIVSDATLEALSPSTCPELYQSIMLGTAVSPGVVTLSGHDREQNWDIQAAKGSTGASTKLNGKPIGQFTATFFLADTDDLAAWAEFKRVSESTINGPTPVALPVYHPDLAANGFTEVVQASMGGMQRDERGGSTVSVKYIEYAPPKPKRAARATSRASAPGGAGGATAEAPDPLAAQRRELAELTAIARQP